MAHAYPDPADELAAAENLWCAVLLHTLRDIKTLEGFEGRTLQRHEYARLRRIMDTCPPARFVESPWFDQVCDFAGYDAKDLRRRLEL